MNTNQDANWGVTKPWFDYIMGTRVISSPDLQESNPLGIKLPRFIENKLNALAQTLCTTRF
jgi:sterol desaturase/sphingolipid hydroxylase (fatty acid hydroxylase superfamily)